MTDLAGLFMAEAGMTVPPRRVIAWPQDRDGQAAILKELLGEVASEALATVTAQLRATEERIAWLEGQQARGGL